MTLDFRVDSTIIYSTFQIKNLIEHYHFHKGKNNTLFCDHILETSVVALQSTPAGSALLYEGNKLLSFSEHW